MTNANLGEQVLFCKLIRDKFLSHVDPVGRSFASGTSTSLRMCSKRGATRGYCLTRDVREVYFGQPFGFDDNHIYMMGNWETLTVDENEKIVSEHVSSQDSIGLPHTKVGVPEDFESMMRDDLVRYYSPLRYVPHSLRVWTWGR